MEYKILTYIALALIAIYILIRASGEWAVKKLVRAEYEHVLNSEEHKVKGRYQ